MEDEDHVFVHESGHALMAVLKGIRLSGICYETTDGKYCTVAGECPSANRSKDDYLYSAAGMAAEKIVYSYYNEVPARLDKADFELSNAPPLTETIDEAMKLMSGYVAEIRTLASMLRERDQRKQDFPEVGMDNDPRKFLVLMNTIEVEEVFRKR